MTHKKDPPKNIYQTQDRGSASDYLQYLSAMDAISVEKVASASVFYNPEPGNILVDVGMASGTSTNILAHLFPQINVIGVDINQKMVELANQTYHQPNLSFMVDDGETLQKLKDNTISGFLNCSSIHHITSYNDYDPNRAYNTIRRQSELLKIGGVIVVRDFVKPPPMEVILELHEPGKGDKPSDADLLITFSKTARSLAKANEQGFPLKELPASSTARRFSLQLTDAVEFIRRKDYFDNWNIELQEEYGYFSQKEFEEIFAELGLRVIVSNPIYNPWIISNRYKGKFTLYNKRMQDIGFPPTNYLIAGEKVGPKSTRIHLVRHLPEQAKPFLNFTSYQHSSSQKIYDVVSRPNSVVDIVPYQHQSNGLRILAKHGYPRPLAALKTDSPLIDEKHFSGYITEGITATLNQNMEQLLADRFGLNKTDYLNIHASLGYYPSPGGIDEKVASFFVELSSDPQPTSQTKDIPGYSDSGSIRSYDALQLLKSAQTGALVEARLELNIYNLLRKLHLPFPKWMGEKIFVSDQTLEPSPITNILKQVDAPYTLTRQNAGYLQKHRVKFAENGPSGGTSILEFVIPENASVNTLITLPIAMKKGNVYVGLETRSLPVPQQHSGNSLIAVAPATRLPKAVRTLKDLEDYLLQMKVLGTPVSRFQKLGEKFFPSIGLTPEQAYLYVVTLSQASNHLKWIQLQELYDHLEEIKDGHLLIAIARLMNALST